MSVNYQVAPLNVVVTPGQTVAEGFTVSSTGTDSSSVYVAVAAITPINPSIYQVNYSDFNVSGATGTAGVAGTANFNEFVTGGAGVILPNGVDKVRFTDNGVDGQVVMEVYFNPTYVIPLTASNPFPVVIDIDGDAQPIVEPPRPPVGTLQRFDLTLDLSDSTPNAKIFSIVPSTVGTFWLNNDGVWNWQSSLDLNLVPGTNFPDFTKATVYFTPYSNNVTEQSPLAGIAAQQFFSAASPLSHSWFWIVPDPGYTISRHNFSITATNNTDNLYTSPGIGASTIDGAIEENGSINLTTQGNQIPSNSTVNTATSEYNLTETANIVDPVGGTYAYSGFTNRAVRATYDPISPLDNQSTIVSINYNDLVNGAFLDVYGATSQILLIDMGSAYTTPQSLQYPYNLSADGFTDGAPPPGSAASDWIDNVVLVGLNGMYNYVPGLNAPDLEINISGKAMPLNNDESTEFNFTLTTGN